MYENQETQAPKLTYEELEAKCVELEGRVTNERERATSYMQQAGRLLDKITAVQEYLDEAWVDHLSGEADDIITEICNKLDISLETEKTFTVSVDFTVTVKANRNFDFDSIDDSDFSADINKSGYGDWTMEEDDYSIESVQQN
jgi:hypothetical protein